MTGMSWNRVVGVVLVAAAFAAPSTAQKKPPRAITTTTDKKLGFKIKAPKFLERVPVKDHDLQTICKLTGHYPMDSRGNVKAKHSLTMLIVQIERQAGPTTGNHGDVSDDASAESMADARNAALNSGRTLEEYLENHGLHGKRSKFEKDPTLLSRKMEAKWGPKFVAYKVGRVDRPNPPYLVAFVTESDTETYGLIAYGYIDENFDAIQRAARSLERKSFDTSYLRPAKDPYEDRELPDIDRRRQVRSKLIEGWHAHDTQNFILVTNVKKTTLVKRMLTDLEVMRAAYIERFPPVDPKALEVVSTVRVCDGYEDYLKYAGQHMRGTGGYWAFIDEELVLFNPERRVPKALRWLGKVDPVAVLYHEAMHQYLYYSNGKTPPAPWFNEGFGEVFGGAKVNRTKKVITEIDRNDFRIGVVRLAKKRKDWPPLEPMLKMTQPEFYERKTVLRNYAFGWAICYFLELEGRKKPDRRNEKWAAIPREYLRHLREAATSRANSAPSDPAAAETWMFNQRFKIQQRAFEKTFADIDMQELETAWIAAMKRW